MVKLTKFEHAFFSFASFSHVTHMCEHIPQDIRTRTHNSAGSMQASTYKFWHRQYTWLTPVLQLSTNLIALKLSKNNIPPLVTDLEITKINRTLPLLVVTTARLLTSLWSSNFNRYDYYQRHLLRKAKITHDVSILCSPLLLQFYSYNYVVSIATLIL
jgi:hypothetical protein